MRDLKLLLSRTDKEHSRCIATILLAVLPVNNSCFTSVPSHTLYPSTVLWYSIAPCLYILEHMAAVSLSIYSKVSERVIKLKWHRNAW